MSDTSPPLPSDARFHGIFAQLKSLNIFDQSSSSDLYGPALADFYNHFVGGFVGDIPVFQRLLPVGAARVLDLACGSGRIGIALAREGVTVDGLELSDDMLALVERNLASESASLRGRLSFIKGDMTNFSLPHRYDLIVLGVTSISLVLKPEDRFRLFRCVREHLAPGGKFVFDIMDFSEGRWTHFDNYQDVWASEFSDGQDFAIVGQKFYPEDRLFVFNVYREFVDWSGGTTRTIGSSTKAWLAREDLVPMLEQCGMKVLEEFRHGDTLFFVSEAIY